MTNILPVRDGQWEVVAWLWQLFRHDLAGVTHAFPYADGRYRHEWLDEHPRDDGAGYLAWAAHPNTAEDAPVGFALVTGVGTGRCSMQAFFVVPAARRTGVGRRLALDVIRRHDEPWQIAFQHDNTGAGIFWRSVARDAWGTAWVETEEAVPGKPLLPPDHWIRTT